MTQPAALCGVLPDQRWHRWPINGREFLIGCQPPADLLLRLPQMAARHARISLTRQGYCWEDLKAPIGTLINGQPVGSRPRYLSGGEEIWIAGAIAFHFDVPNGSPRAPAPPARRGVSIDPDLGQVWVDGVPIHPPLSAHQYRLIRLLYEFRGLIVGRDQIAAAVWPDADPAGVSKQAVDGLIKRLRRRLHEAQPADRQYIEVRRGHGICLLEPED